MRAAAAQKGDIDIALNALGTVTSLSTVTVRTQVSGQLVKIDFQEGQAVNRATCWRRSIRSPSRPLSQQMQGQMDRDQALLSGAKVDLERYRKLAEQKAIPTQQLDTQRALVRQYEGQVAADQGQLTRQGQSRLCTGSSSPLDRPRRDCVRSTRGITSRRAMRMALSSSPRSQPISVIFTVPEDNLPAILKRVHAGVELPVTIADRSGSNKLADGKLTTLDNQIDTTTGTVKLRAEFANEDEDALSEPVRQRPAAGRHSQGRDGDTDARRPARRAGHVRLSRQSRQHRVGAPDRARPDRWRARRRHQGSRAGRPRRHRRRRPAARWRKISLRDEAGAAPGGDAAGAATRRMIRRARRPRTAAGCCLKERRR